MLLLCAQLVWQLIDGTVHEGIFHTMKVDGKHTHVVLKYAKVTKDPSVTAEDLQVGSSCGIVWTIRRWQLLRMAAL